MNPSATPANARPALDFSALRSFAVVCASIGATTILADYLLWGGEFGISVGIFFAALGALLLVRHQAKPRWSAWLLVLLLGATCVQTAIELSLSNVLAASMLTLALAGEAFQSHLKGLWPRMSEVSFGIITSPARWIGFKESAERSFTGMHTSELDLAGRSAFLLKMIAPAAVLIAIFGWMFATGNPVFNNLLERANDMATQFWSELNLSLNRVLWWTSVATLALGIFHGTRAPALPRPWAREIPRIPRTEPRLAVWQSALALLAVNALFCMVNTLDAIFLWGLSTVPAGVNASDFLHSGVNSLIAAVVLSAIIIASMFQQEDAAVNRPWVKILAHLWVVQNLMLLGSVARRLVLYTDSYLLTEKRVYVGFFLALVAVGFLLLAWFVQRRRSLNWLVGRNALATFALFFTVQFLDVAGWVAKHNVARWTKGAGLDLDYLSSLGPTAWPELIKVARSPGARKAATAKEAHTLLVNLFHEERPTDWRAYQQRRATGVAYLAAYMANPAPLSK